MCHAKKIAQQIIDLTNEANNLFNEYTDKLKNIEYKIMDVLHYIEGDNFNACQGYVYAKKLKELRTERRSIKNELEPLQMLRSRMNNSLNINELTKTVDAIHKKETVLQKCTDNKIYNPRAITKEEVFLQ